MTIKKKTSKNSDGQTFRGDFINIIPEQKAANIFYDSGLLNEGKDWCQINPISFEVDRFKDIYAVGDSIDAFGQCLNLHFQQTVKLKYWL